MRRSTLLAAGLAPLLLPACSEPAPAPPAERASRVDAPPPAGDAEAAGEIAAMLSLAIQELTAEDIEATALAGELGCSFAPRPGGETLFLGRGDVIRSAGAEGLVKLPDGVRKLAMRGRGGFDAMSDGARFEGERLRVDITLSGDRQLAETPAIAAESPRIPAVMSVRSGSREVAVQGVYECGP